MASNIDPILLNSFDCGMLGIIEMNLKFKKGKATFILVFFNLLYKKSLRGIGNVNLAMFSNVNNSRSRKMEENIWLHQTI